MVREGINYLNLDILGLGNGIVELNLGGEMKIMIYLLYDRLYIICIVLFFNMQV